MAKGLIGSQRVPCWSLSPTPCLTHFWSDHPVLHWLVKCMMNWAGFSIQMIVLCSFECSWYPTRLSSVNMCHCPFEGFGGNQPVSIAMLWPVRNTWQPLFCVFLVPNLHGGVMTSWSAQVIGSWNPLLPCESLGSPLARDTLYRVTLCQVLWSSISLALTPYSIKIIIIIPMISSKYNKCLKSMMPA